MLWVSLTFMPFSPLPGYAPKTPSVAYYGCVCSFAGPHLWLTWKAKGRRKQARVEERLPLTGNAAMTLTLTLLIHFIVQDSEEESDFDLQGYSLTHLNETQPLTPANSLVHGEG